MLILVVMWHNFLGGIDRRVVREWGLPGMKSDNKHSLQGNWLGNYYYKSVNQPQAFEAVFVECNGMVDGNILDDGRLGEARVTGTFTYPNLTFVKKYDRAGADPVRYEGRMDEDGKRIAGSWRINATCSGTWVVWRSDDEELDEKTTEKSEELQLETALATSASR